MRSRGNDLDVKLLLYAVQKTTSFEKTLAQRFFQSPYMEEVMEKSLNVCSTHLRAHSPEMELKLC